jgi:maltooligosyltrehalose trehalohydrolase
VSAAVDPRTPAADSPGRDAEPAHAPRAAIAAPLPLGAHARADGTASFAVWSPAANRLSVRLHDRTDRTVALARDGRGYHTAVIDDVTPGTRYSLVLPDGALLPDPASRLQPDGVHGPSEIVATAFDWQAVAWRQPELRDLVIYEMHVGTFTAEGTFDAAIERLPALRELGITAVELMPVAQFPGNRNWGYDGVFAFAVQNSYGGPAALKRFVDAAHAHDLNVVLDVVYNHLGPEGNYLLRHGPYFTDTYHTPWGAALNFDDAGSDEVRRYFIESALQWTDEFRIDGLRLDAIHAMLDRSAQPFLRQLADAVHERAAGHGRTVILIAESDLGDPRVLRSERLGGLDLDAQWLDDFHHSLRTLLTGEDTGYYIDFGTLDHLARAFQHGFVYAGEYSRYRGRRHGAPAPDILPRQFVVYAQNHDQIGNRMIGDRLSATVSAARLRLAGAAVLLSPFTPMLFMGEEYGSLAPFPFFTDFDDAQLIEAVRSGRRAEFASFSWEGEPPDPQSPATFRDAVLDWDARMDERHAPVLALHRRLIELRRTAPGIHAADAMSTDVLDTAGRPADGSSAQGVISVLRRAARQSSLLLLNFAAGRACIDVPATGQVWRCALDTESPEFGGGGSDIPDTIGSAGHRIQLAAHSAVLLLHDEE